MTLTKLIIAAIATASISVPAFAADVKIGLIDMQKAIQETTAGKKAKKELDEEFNKKKKDLEKLEVEIKKKGEDFDKRSMAMNEDARNKKQAEIQGEMRKYQEQAAKSQMEIQKRERELSQPIITKIRGIIEDIAKKEDFAMILERSEQGVMWAKKEFDLTDRIVHEFDKKEKKK
jgi:outer membrane protein